MSHPEDIIAEMSRAIESIRSEETGGCFKPSEADQQGECADHDCYCARQCDEAARACWAVVSKRMAKALEDPPHAEYERLVEAVARLAEDEPMPKREIPLAFIIALLHFRRHEFGFAPPPSSAEEGSRDV